MLDVFPPFNRRPLAQRDERRMRWLSRTPIAPWKPTPKKRKRRVKSVNAKRASA